MNTSNRSVPDPAVWLRPAPQEPSRLMSVAASCRRAAAMTWRLGPEWDIDGVSVLLVGVAFQAVPKVTVLVSSEPAITTSARSVPAGAVCVSPVAQEIGRAHV